MSVQSPPRNTAAWIVAGVLGLLAAVLVVLLVHVASVRASDSKDSGSTTLVAPTADQQQAVQSGAIEAANLTTLSRANYRR